MTLQQNDYWIDFRDSHLNNTLTTNPSRQMLDFTFL